MSNKSDDGCDKNPDGKECLCDKIPIGEAWSLALGLAGSILTALPLPTAILGYAAQLLSGPFKLKDNFDLWGALQCQGIVSLD